MGSVAAPWKSLLLRALKSNGQIKHSKFLQLVHFPLSVSFLLKLKFPFIFFTAGFYVEFVFRQRLDLMEGPQIAQSFSEDLKRALIGSIFSRILEVARFFYGEALYFVLARSIHAAIAVFLWFLMQ